MTVKISVIIPAYNEEAYIENCLKSLKEQTVQPFEVIVIDNNSKDRTNEIAKRLADKVIFEKKQGVVYALNTGVNAAKGNVVAFIGGDCIADKNWLCGIKTAFEKNSRVVEVYGPIASMDRNNRKLRFVYYFIWHVVAKTLSHTPIAMAPGGNSAVRRDAFLQAGGYDPMMVPGEDIELSTRLRKIGKLRFIANSKVYASTRRFDQNSVWKETKGWLKVFFRIIIRRPKKYEYFKYD